ncbi:MAG: type II secretion system protein [Aquincola sp.]|nr:type II secretion system protein [Aquincola sp.]
MARSRPAFRRTRPRRPQGGVVLLALLLALALGGIALMAAVDVWSLTRQRAQEQELLFVGDQYRQAIQRYYFGAPPGSPRVLPASLADLLEDDRYPVPVRHLRRPYPDPVTGGAEWGVLHVGNRIAGVYSVSDKEPIKQAGFARGYQFFEGLKTYRDWTFAVSATGRPILVNHADGDTPDTGIAPPDRKRPVNRTHS